jgi:hypothetical protein
MVAFLLTTVAVLGLSFMDAPLEQPANPSKPTNPSKAPWYFLGLQEMVSYSAFWGGVGIPALMILGLAAVPYLDRNPHGEGIWFHRSRYLGIFLWTLFMTIQALFIIIGTFFRGANWGWIWPWTLTYAQH